MAEEKEFYGAAMPPGAIWLPRERRAKQRAWFKNVVAGANAKPIRHSGAALLARHKARMIAPTPTAALRLPATRAEKPLLTTRRKSTADRTAARKKFHGKR